MPSASTLRRAFAAALCAAAAVPAVASADSITYVAGGNVWMATTDGARTYQVTSDGGWTYASQSDTGVLVASKGSSLFRLARTGEVLARLNTIIMGPFHGPYDPQVSPDGTHVAYGYIHQGTSIANGTAYTNTDGSSPGWTIHTGWTWPAWLDDVTLLHSERPNGGSDALIVRDAGSPNNTGEQWEDEREHHDLYDADIKPGVVVGVGNAGAVLNVYRYAGAAGRSALDGCMSYTGPAGKFESPTLGAGGRTLFWNEADGIWGAGVPDLAGGCTDGQQGRLIVPGGRFPDWSAADVPPARPVPSPPGPAPAPAPAPAPPPVPAPKPALQARLAAPVTLAKALRSGFTVTIGAAGTSKVQVTASISGATARKAGLGRKALVVASGSAKPKNGTARVTLRFAKTRVRKLRRLRALALTLKLADGRTATVTLRT